MIAAQRTVLLVDDDARLLRGLQRVLNDAGLHVLTAVSAAEGLAALKCFHVDAVICDNRMAGVSGRAFLATVRSRYPGVVRFMLTGDITPGDAVRVVNDIGVCRLFKKPCDPQDILTAVRQVFDTLDHGVASSDGRDSAAVSC